MARGNDSAAAAAEFRGQYGLSGNAEDLIQANRSAYPADLRAASLLPLNEEATAELDLDKVASEAGAGDGSRVIGAAVRGDKVVAVIETESGHTYKSVLSADDVGVDTTTRHSALRKLAPNVEDDPNQIVAQAQVEARLEIERARKEAEKIVQEARDEAQQKASESAQKAAQDARDAAAKEAESAADADESSRGRGAQSGGGSKQDKEAAKEQSKKD